MLEYLRTNGFKLTITSLECGHGLLTTSGNVSEHTHRRRGRHRRHQRHPGDRPPGPGDGDRRTDPRRPAPAGDDAPPPGDLARGPARRNQLRAARPLRPRPRRLPRDRRRQPRSAVRRPAQTGPVAAPDRPPRPDRKPRSAGQALEVLAAGQRPTAASAGRRQHGDCRENPVLAAIRIRAARLRRRPAAGRRPLPGARPSRRRRRASSSCRRLGAPAAASRRRRRRPRKAEPAPSRRRCP